MSAIRAARGFTGRPKIVKCTGCYHGHTDALLVQAGSGAMTLGTPSSPGVPASVTEHTLLVPYNDLDAMRAVLAKHPRDIAAVFVEPVAGNMGCVPPRDEYLRGLRDLCDHYNALLVLDEVMTGFRVAWGGAQALYNVVPDMTCLGKIVGGGLPCAAYGGRAEIMRKIAPDGPVYQAGTLSGNPLAMAAAIAMLTELKKPGVYEKLERTSADLAAGLAAAAKKANVPVEVTRVGSMLTPFFSASAVTNYEEALRCRTDRFAAFFRTMLDEGVVLPPSQFEAWFVSTAHDATTTHDTLAAAERAFAAAATIN
jgi:glutamate-1-semialdehyde 2,1-aminomutase